MSSGLKFKSTTYFFMEKDSSDARLTGDQEFPGLIPTNILETDHEIIFSKVILSLPLIQGSC